MKLTSARTKSRLGLALATFAVLTLVPVTASADDSRRRGDDRRRYERHDRHDRGRYERRHRSEHRRYDRGQRHDRGRRYDRGRAHRYERHRPSSHLRRHLRRHFSIPRQILRHLAHDFLSYHYGRHYYRKHGHYHEIYRFPSYDSYGRVSYRPYDYCEGQHFATGNFRRRGNDVIVVFED